MEILKYPHPFLRIRSKEVGEITDEIRAKVREMFEAMAEARGVGLAATQVGWDARIFVKNVTGTPEGEEVHVNPVILEQSGEEVDEEGCLSLPGIRGRVDRAQEILLRSTGLDGETQEIRLQDLAARTVQHEIDHLDGILFVQRLRPADRVLVRRSLRELERESKAHKERATPR